MELASSHSQLRATLIETTLTVTRARPSRSETTSLTSIKTPSLCPNSITNSMKLGNLLQRSKGRAMIVKIVGNCRAKKTAHSLRKIGFKPHWNQMTEMSLMKLLTTCDSSMEGVKLTSRLMHLHLQRTLKAIQLFSMRTPRLVAKTQP